MYERVSYHDRHFRQNVFWDVIVVCLCLCVSLSVSVCLRSMEGFAEVREATTCCITFERLHVGVRAGKAKFFLY